MSDAVIDLRSDTVTLPSDQMRAVMAAAPVGDDQFGEDPSANLLQERIAALLDKEAALWVPTGTMANQIALRVLTRPGDDVIVSAESHSVLHETGAGGANAGVQFTALGSRGTFTVDEFEAAVKPSGHVIYPPTTLVQIENTHNRAGGTVFPAEQVRDICQSAVEKGLAKYLDGARLWHAAVAGGRSAAELAAPFDLLAVALSKGLGAPGGSVLAGDAAMIARCVRYRRMLGGAMRQIGHFAAAGLYALDHNLARLSEDHAKARLLAERLAACPGVRVDLDTVQTNIVMFHLAPDAPDAATVVEAARQHGVLVFAFGPRTIRAVTHLDVSGAQCGEAAAVFREVVAGV